MLLWKAKTVDGILGRFKTVITDLEDHGNAMVVEAEQHAKDAAAAVVKKEQALYEHVRAFDIAGKLKALFG